MPTLTGHHCSVSNKCPRWARSIFTFYITLQGACSKTLPHTPTNTPYQLPTDRRDSHTTVKDHNISSRQSTDQLLTVSHWLQCPTGFGLLYWYLSLGIATSSFSNRAEEVMWKASFPHVLRQPRYTEGSVSQFLHSSRSIGSATMSRSE